MWYEYFAMYCKTYSILFLLGTLSWLLHLFVSKRNHNIIAKIFGLFVIFTILIIPITTLKFLYHTCKILWDNILVEEKE